MTGGSGSGVGSGVGVVPDGSEPDGSLPDGVPEGVPDGALGGVFSVRLSEILTKTWVIALKIEPNISPIPHPPAQEVSKHRERIKHIINLLGLFFIISPP